MGDASMRNQASCDDQDRPIVEMDGSVCEDEALVDKCQDVSFSSSEVLEDQTTEALSCSGTSEREVSDVDDSPIDFFKDPPYTDFTAKAPKAKEATRVFDEFGNVMDTNYLTKGASDDSLKNYKLLKSEVEDSEKDCEPEYEDCNYSNPNDPQYCIDTNNQQGEGVVAGELIGNLNENTLEEDDICVSHSEEDKLLKAEVEDSKEDYRQECEDYNYNDHQYGMDTNNQEGEGVVAGELMGILNGNKEVNLKHIKTRMVQILREFGILLKNTDNREIRSVKFSTVYEKLRSGPPQDTCEEVSVPTAFFVLIDLANDGSFHLKMSGNIKDVLITNEIPLPPHLR